MQKILFTFCLAMCLVSNLGKTLLNLFGNQVCCVKKLAESCQEEAFSPLSEASIHVRRARKAAESPRDTESCPAKCATILGNSQGTFAIIHHKP